MSIENMDFPRGYDYRRVHDPDVGVWGAAPCLAELVDSPIISIDVESTGLNLGTARAVGMSVACGKNGSVFVRPDDKFFFDTIKLEDKLVLGHNIKYDRAVLKKHGIYFDHVADTMIAAQMLGKAGLSLESLAAASMDVLLPQFSKLPRGTDISTWDIHQLAGYFGSHAVAPLHLWWGSDTHKDDKDTDYRSPYKDYIRGFEKSIIDKQLSQAFWGVEMPLVPVLSDIESNGVAVSEGRLRELGIEIDTRLAELLKELDALAYKFGVIGMNHNSPEQVSALIYGKMGAPLPDRQMAKAGVYSVDKRELIKILGDKQSTSAKPYIEKYLAFKELMTLKSSYVDSLIPAIVNGRIHCNFNQASTSTGRLSSSNPNLQKIPARTEVGKRVRSAFVARDGRVLVKSDYNQLELRVMAHCSNCKEMLEAFNADRDIHEETAFLIYGDRKRRPEGKTRNFEMIYGGGTPENKDAFFRAYPIIRVWNAQNGMQAFEEHMVRTLHGRIRTFPADGLGKNAIIREAISTIVQGSSAEYVKKGMRRCWDTLKHEGWPADMVLQVHDEVVFELDTLGLKGDHLANYVREFCKMVDSTMTIGVDELKLPLTVEIKSGPDWASMEKVNLKGE